MHPVPARPGKGRARRWPSYRPRHIGQHEYTETVTVPFYAQAQTTVSAAGLANVRVGPAGVGTKWYPALAVFSTTTGPSDGSYVTIHFGYVAVATLINGQVYNGGGDSAGLAISMMTPGDVIIATWAGATPGDKATLTVSGTQDALVVPG